MARLTSEQVREIASLLEGTCNSVESALERLDLEDVPVEEVEDRLLDVNLERCPICDWWVESSEIVNDNCEIVGCESCREPEKEE
jgi:hypothetical protein